MIDKPIIGRPLKYNEKTKAMCIRIPVSKETQVRQLIENFLKTFEY